MPVQFSGTQYIAVPREKVFQELTNLDGPKQWMKGFVRAEILKGDKQVTTGSVWRATRKMFGKDSTEQFEAISVTPYKEIKMQIDGTKGTSGKGIYNFQYILEDKNGGTDVTMNGEIIGMKGLAALFFKLFMGYFKKAIMKDLKTLKEYLETGKKVQ